MLSDGKSRFSIIGKPIHHFQLCIAKINPDAPLDKVCVRFGATVNVAKPKKGSNVAIFEMGAVGLAAVDAARVASVLRIIGVDLNTSRFETEFVNPKDHDKPVQEVIAEMTDGGDRSVEFTGSIQAMISAFEYDAFKIHPVNFLNERTLKGTFYGNFKPRTDIPKVVERNHCIYRSSGIMQELEVEKFITHESCSLIRMQALTHLDFTLPNMIMDLNVALDVEHLDPGSVGARNNDLMDLYMPFNVNILSLLYYLLPLLHDTTEAKEQGCQEQEASKRDHDNHNDCWVVVRTGRCLGGGEGGGRIGCGGGECGGGGGDGECGGGDGDGGGECGGGDGGGGEAGLPENPDRNVIVDYPFKQGKDVYIAIGIAVVE
ncbi:hypothetical protein V2J09_007654 [Rumex salicifolius]